MAVIPPQPPSKCAKAQKKKISDYLNTLVDAVQNAARALYHKLGQLLCALAQALLTELEPVFALEKLVVENFVIFPLNAVKKTLSTVTNTIAGPINSVADSTCKQHGAAIKTLQNWANGAKALSNKFGTFADSSTKRLKEMDDEIQGWQVACGVLGTDLQSV
jgi:hypothetical protein